MKPYQKQFNENSFVKSEAYWINPYGDILAVDSNHIAEVIKNPEAFGLTLETIKAIHDVAEEPVGIEGRAREKIIKDLILQGWMRLRYYRRNDMWTVNVARLAKRQKDLLYHWAKEMIAHGGAGVQHSEVKIDLPTSVITSSIEKIAQDALYAESEKKNTNKYKLKMVKEFKKYKGNQNEKV